MYSNNLFPPNLNTDHICYISAAQFSVLIDDLEAGRPIQEKCYICKAENGIYTAVNKELQNREFLQHDTAVEWLNGVFSIELFSAYTEYRKREQQIKNMPPLKETIGTRAVCTLPELYGTVFKDQVAHGKTCYEEIDTKFATLAHIGRISDPLSIQKALQEISPQAVQDNLYAHKLFINRVIPFWRRMQHMKLSIKSEGKNNGAR